MAILEKKSREARLNAPFNVWKRQIKLLQSQSEGELAAESGMVLGQNGYGKVWNTVAISSGDYYMHIHTNPKAPGIIN